MTIERVKQAAWIRGIYFSGEKLWRNCTVGYAYEFYTPNGRGFMQCQTLYGAYREIMKYPKLEG